MKLIILDRDGVINKDSDEYIKSPEEFIPIPGSLEAIARLNHAGYIVVVISNQSGIARRYFDTETLHNIHEKLRNLLNDIGGHIDVLLYCPHGPDDKCKCRKPKPGLFEELKNRLHVRLDNTIAVGDSLRDLQAAEASGAKPVLVKTGKGMRTLRKNTLSKTIPVYGSLADVVNDLLSQEEKE
ncbi:MAG: D-glycero-beta-D-manno-heptose 1,7-bisphosphate 7-phosphatase [Gammaproteobacteria bacterium]|nr:D-glycero-beta-D-manno-heptose 1,7-bisphosphate 7-phosphatase [Gammaproteobacteria bacterium]